MNTVSFSHFVPVGPRFQSKARQPKAPIAPPQDSLHLRARQSHPTFGMMNPDGPNDPPPTFANLAKQTGRVLSSKATKTKNAVKKELKKDGSAKRIGLGAGLLALGAEVMTGGMTGGALGTAIFSAAGGYGAASVAKGQIKKAEARKEANARAADAYSDGGHESDGEV